MALTDKLTAVADAIRNKTGKTEVMTLDQMPVEIDGINTGGGQINTGTCSVKIAVPGTGNYYFAYEQVESSGNIAYRIDRNYLSSGAASTKTVRCDSIMYIQASGINGVEISDGELIYILSNYGVVYKTPHTAGATAEIVLLAL